MLKMYMYICKLSYFVILFQVALKTHASNLSVSQFLI